MLGPGCFETDQLGVVWTDFNPMDPNPAISARAVHP